MSRGTIYLEFIDKSRLSLKWPETGEMATLVNNIAYPRLITVEHKHLLLTYNVPNRSISLCWGSSVVKRKDVTPEEFAFLADVLNEVISLEEES